METSDFEDLNRRVVLVTGDWWRQRPGRRHLHDAL